MGFYVLSPEEWERLFRQASFRDVAVECIEVAGIGADGRPNKRCPTRISARQ
jgi:hypothetical protein